MRGNLLAACSAATALIFAFSAAPALAAANLAKAASDHNVKKVQKLLDGGAQVDEPDDHGRTALFHTAVQGDLALLQQLADKGAAVDRRDDTGATPLIAALRNPATPLAVVRFLLGKGADINAIDKTGRTPLMEAVLRASGTLDTETQVALVGALLTAGADPGAADLSGATALHHAAYVGEPRKMLELLLAASKNPNAVTLSGANVLMMATQNHQRANADFLLARGYRPVRIHAVPGVAGDKPELAQDQTPRANALAEDWWGQYAARNGDAASARTAFAAAAADYDAAAAEARRLGAAFEAELAADRAARARQQTSIAVANIIGMALSMGTGAGVTLYMPNPTMKLEADQQRIVELKAEVEEATARATMLRAEVATK